MLCNALELKYSCCAMHWNSIAYISIVVQCIEVALLIISIVVQCIGIALLNIHCIAVQCYRNKEAIY